VEWWGDAVSVKASTAGVLANGQDSLATLEIRIDQLLKKSRAHAEQSGMGVVRPGD
jgi:hypothetical protein